VLVVVVVAPSGTKSLGIRLKYGMLWYGMPCKVWVMLKKKKKKKKAHQGCPSLGRSLTYEMSKGE
jgi:hypothetical protein